MQLPLRWDMCQLLCYQKSYTPLAAKLGKECPFWTHNMGEAGAGSGLQDSCKKKKQNKPTRNPHKKPQNPNKTISYLQSRLCVLLEWASSFLE